MDAGNLSRAAGRHGGGLRRGAAVAACALLIHLAAVNLLWEFATDTGSMGVALDLTARLTGSPWRIPVAMLLPWAHVALVIVACVLASRAIAGSGARPAPRRSGTIAPSEDPAPALFVHAGLQVIAASCSVAAIVYLGQASIEAKSLSRPVTTRSVADVADATELEVATRLQARADQGAIVEARRLNRRSSARRDVYVPLVPVSGAAPEIRVLLAFDLPAREALNPQAWAPPYLVRRRFEPIPTWVRGTLERSGRPVAADAVLVERLLLDASDRPIAHGTDALWTAIATVAVGGFVGLLLLGLHVLMRGSSGAPRRPAPP